MDPTDHHKNHNNQILIDVPSMRCFAGVVHGAAGSGYAAYANPPDAASTKSVASRVTGATVSIHGPRQLTSLSNRTTSIATESRISVVARAEDAGVVLLPALGTIPSSHTNHEQEDRELDAVPLGLTIDVPVTGFHNTQTMTNMERAVAAAVHQSLLAMVFLERCGQALYDVVVSFSVHDSDPFHRVFDVAITAASLAAADAHLELRDLVSGTTLWVVNRGELHHPGTSDSLDPSSKEKRFDVIVPNRKGLGSFSPCRPYATIHIASATQSADIAYLYLEGGVPLDLEDETNGQEARDLDHTFPCNQHKEKNESNENLLERIMACGIRVNQMRRDDMIRALRESHRTPDELKEQ